MTIEKKDLLQLDYVDGPPSEGQARIDWIQIGECLGATTGPTDNSGELNRGPVKVQINVETVNSNTITNKEAIDEITDVVNAHTALITDGSMGTITDRLDDAEARLTVNEGDIDNSEIAIGTNTTAIEAIRLDVGSDGTETKTVREELDAIIRETGNYGGFDYDGQPHAGEIASGMKSRISENSTDIALHDIDITALKQAIIETPDAQEVAALRTELGPANQAGIGTVYERLDSIELGDATPEVESLLEIVKPETYPHSYEIDSVQYEAGDIPEHLEQHRGEIDGQRSDLSSVTQRVGAIELDLGTPTLANGTVWANVESLTVDTGANTANTNNNTLLIQTMDTQVTALNQNVANLNTVVNLEHEQKLAALNLSVYATGPTDKNSLTFKMDGGSSIDTFETLGVYEASRELYEEFLNGGGDLSNPDLPTINPTKHSFVRYWTGTEWSWDSVSTNTTDNTRFHAIDVSNVDNAVAINAISYSPLGPEGTVLIGGTQDAETQLLDTITANIRMKDTFGLSRVANQNIISFDGTNTVVGVDGDMTIIQGQGVDGVRYKTDVIMHQGNLSNYIDDVFEAVDLTIGLGRGIIGTTPNGPANIATVNNLTLEIGTGLDTQSIEWGLAEHDSIRVSQLVAKKDNGDDMALIGQTGAVGSETIDVGTINNDLFLNGLSTPRIKLSTDNAGVSHEIWHDGNAPDSVGSTTVYGRSNGQWVDLGNISGGGIGGGFPDVPLTPMFEGQWLRAQNAGVTSWEQIGSKNITMYNASDFYYETNVGLRKLLTTSFDGTVELNYDDPLSRTQIFGRVYDIDFDRNAVIGFAKQNQDVISGVHLDSLDNVVIGDGSTGVSLHVDALTSAKVTVGTNDFRIWTDDDDAPVVTGTFAGYARSRGQWIQMYQGVNPDANLNINPISSFTIDNKLVATAINDVITIGEDGEKLRVSGDIVDGITLTTQAIGSIVPATISVKDGVYDVNVVTYAQDVLTLGDADKALEIEADSAKINGDNVLTQNAHEAPQDGFKYSRRDAEWTRTYQYGDGLDDFEGVPQEGDVFFTFNS